MTVLVCGWDLTWLRYRPVVDCYEHCDEPSGSMKASIFTGLANVSF
jgi:hypothetical protein